MLCGPGPATSGAGDDARFRAGPPKALHDAWNGKMFAPRSDAGTFGQGGVSIDDAARSGAGIVISDVRDLRRGNGPRHTSLGWELRGGLLGRVTVAAVRVELFGKTIEMHTSCRHPFIHMDLGCETWRFAHELILVRRGGAEETATIVRMWSVPDGGPRTSYFVGRLRPIGFVEYDESSRMVIVKSDDRLAARQRALHRGSGPLPCGRVCSSGAFSNTTRWRDWPPCASATVWTASSSLTAWPSPGRHRSEGLVHEGDVKSVSP
jgi:hypothetical protein